MQLKDVFPDARFYPIAQPEWFVQIGDGTYGIKETSDGALSIELTADFLATHEQH